AHPGLDPEVPLELGAQAVVRTIDARQIAAELEHRDTEPARAIGRVRREPRLADAGRTVERDDRALAPAGQSIERGIEDRADLRTTDEQLATAVPRASARTERSPDRHDLVAHADRRTGLELDGLFGREVARVVERHACLG